MKTRIGAFGAGVTEAGWVEGKNITVKYGYGCGKLDQLTTIAT
jgi:hypothetical protein